MLLYENGRFLQTLEGPPAGLQQVWSSICRDRRHREIEVLTEHLVSNRLFAGWDLLLYSREDDKRRKAEAEARQRESEELLAAEGAGRQAAQVLLFLGQHRRRGIQAIIQPRLQLRAFFAVPLFHRAQPLAQLGIGRALRLQCGLQRGNLCRLIARTCHGIRRLGLARRRRPVRRGRPRP